MVTIEADQTSDQTGDGYTGAVSVGGEPDTRELPHLTITKVAVDPQMSNNCYVLTCRRTGDRVLIDAAAEPATLLPLLGDKLSMVVTTHQHWDHHRALADVVAATGAEVAAGDPDADEIATQTGVSIARRLTHGDKVSVGACSLEVIAIAGHTPGSVALLYDDTSEHGGAHLFTGDSLFPGGVGATFGDDKAALFEQLLGEVETKIFARLPDDTWFYPGHGDDSTIGTERPHLDEWRARGY
jgi:glyoxylase-like metal-dependent hydrolase (beta-lactamase superfamily II)